MHDSDPHKTITNVLDGAGLGLGLSAALHVVVGWQVVPDAAGRAAALAAAGRVLGTAAAAGAQHHAARLGGRGLLAVLLREGHGHVAAVVPGVVVALVVRGDGAHVAGAGAAAGAAAEEGR